MTEIDISPEAVEHPPFTQDDVDVMAQGQRDMGYYKWAALIDALSAALTQSRAETAAAYERAAGMFDADSNIAQTLRALTTPDQSSALAAIEAAAEARGMRKAAEIAWAQEDGDRWTRASIQAAILAAIPQGDATND